MNDLWERAKRELRNMILESGRPDLTLAVISGVLAWALVTMLRFLAALTLSM
jgi:hypothetical protein